MTQKKNHLKAKQICRMILYVTIAVLIFIFPDFFALHAAFTVGGVMILFGLDELISALIVRKNLLGDPALISSFIAVFGGILMMIFLHRTGDHDELIKICVIWAVWSISQEGFELAGVIREWKENKAVVISGIESAAVIILSILLVIDPEEHYRMHITILGIELILKFAFPLLFGLTKAIAEKRSQK
ncbi:MAG: hypothetical protein IK088_06265 [Lachnospiraceae bacterium]|nr:hypothetical protein [Lachnospiraceae bacterium]